MVVLPAALALQHPHPLLACETHDGFEFLKLPYPPCVLTFFKRTRGEKGGRGEGGENINNKNLWSINKKSHS